MRHLPQQAALSVIGFALLLALVLLADPRPPGEPVAARPSRVVDSVTPARTAVVTVPRGTSPSAGPLPTSGPSPSSDASAMLGIHNELRAAIGAPRVSADPRVAAAAQRHAEYLVRNSAGGHDEAPLLPGFTGADVRARLAAQGYPTTTASEVATSVGPGTDGVRSLWVLPYHRLGLMHPHAVVAGWGYAESGGRQATVGVLVYDFGSTAPDLVRSPAAGQRVVGSWDGRELPDVLPRGANRPVGYPVMVLASMARTVDLRGARITGPNGETVPHHVVPVIYERDYVAIVPTRPLEFAQQIKHRHAVADAQSASCNECCREMPGRGQPRCAQAKPVGVAELERSSVDGRIEIDVQLREQRRGLRVCTEQQVLPVVEHMCLAVEHQRQTPCAPA